MACRTFAVWVLSCGYVAAASNACSSGAARPPAEGELAGSATAALQLTPPSVRCISFQVSNGTASVTQSFAVTPATDPAYTLAGLPLGMDTFQASASATACGDAGASPATFTSAPVMATVASGSSPSVTLTMQPVMDGGGAAVGINFPQPTSGIVTEFPSPVGLPLGLALGPDGNLWTGAGFTKMARVTPGGVFTAFPMPMNWAGEGPQFVVAGSDGNIWFTSDANVTATPPVPAQLGRVSLDGTRFALVNAPTPTSSLSRFSGSPPVPTGRSGSWTGVSITSFDFRPREASRGSSRSLGWRPSPTSSRARTGTCGSPKPRRLVDCRSPER